MTSTITTGAGTITPTLLLGYQAARQAQTIVHPILGRADPDVTLRPATLRTGTLGMGFSGVGSAAASKAAEDLLATAALFTLSDTDLPSIGMKFAVTGNITRELEDETRSAWLVSVDYTEVL